MTDSTPHSTLGELLAHLHSGPEHLIQLTEDWTQGRTMFGGLVAALLLQALETEVEPDRGVRSVLVHFAGPVVPGEVHIRSRTLRSGKSITHSQAELIQNGEVCTTMNGVFGGARRTGLSMKARPPQVAPQVQDVKRLPHLPGRMPNFLRHFAMYWVSTERLFSGGTSGKIAGYVAHDPSGPPYGPGLLALMDAWPPTALTMTDAPAMASTVTWMVDFLAGPPQVPKDSAAPHFYQAETVAVADGYSSTHGQLWAPDGTPLLAAQQMIAEFSRPS